MLKVFFKAVRFILGGIIVLGDKAFPPRTTKLTETQQNQINEKAKKLALYQFPSCPFCIKVRRMSKRLSIPLETRNILKNEQWHTQLVSEGGARKVPCLRIETEEGNTSWLYESTAINDYLEANYSYH